jgi:hypothetical protein
MIKYLHGAAGGYGQGTTVKDLRGAAGIGLGSKIRYLRRATSGATGSGLRTMIKYLRGPARRRGLPCFGLGTTTKYLRRTTSAAAGIGLVTTIKHLLNQNAGAGSYLAKAHYRGLGTNLAESRCRVAAFVVNSVRAHDGTKHQLPSAFAWVVGHGG